MIDGKWSRWWFVNGHCLFNNELLTSWLMLSELNDSLFNTFEWVHKTNLTPPLFIEVAMPSQECDRSCICLLLISILPLLFLRFFYCILQLFWQCIRCFSIYYMHSLLPNQYKWSLVWLTTSDLLKLKQCNYIE